MYARGEAFFESLLPSLGIRNADDSYAGQKAGYFCLQNKYWRVIGLAIGYYSVGKPLLEFLPWFAPDCHFDDKQMEWLKNMVKLGDPNDKRGVLVLTHPQFISALLVIEKA